MCWADPGPVDLLHTLVQLQPSHGRMRTAVGLTRVWGGSKEPARMEEAGQGCGVGRPARMEEAGQGCGGSRPRRTEEAGQR
eukprot:46056-Chlamydomonas_euryale.AAC.1